MRQQVVEGGHVEIKMRARHSSSRKAAAAAMKKVPGTAKMEALEELARKI